MQPKVITLPHCSICVVEVPEGTDQPELNFNKDMAVFWDEAGSVEQDLPPGDWSILGVWPDQITEEQAKGLVKEYEIVWAGETYKGYYDYKLDNPELDPWEHYCYDWPFDEAIPALETLLISNGIQVEGKKHLLLIDKK